MPRTTEEVVFSVVGVERRPAKPAPRPPKRRELPAFPLVGPILDRASGRTLRGVCGRCDTRIRVRVKGPGTVRVTCPICGHARRLQV